MGKLTILSFSCIFLCNFNSSLGCDEHLLKDIVNRVESLESSNKILIQNDIKQQQLIERQEKKIRQLEEKLESKQAKSSNWEHVIKHNYEHPSQNNYRKPVIKQHSEHLTHREPVKKQLPEHSRTSPNRDQVVNDVINGYPYNYTDYRGAEEIFQKNPTPIEDHRGDTVRSLPNHLDIHNGKLRSLRATQYASDVIAFHATINRGEISHLGNGDMIVFDNVVLNVGAGYHSSAGIFIAPKSGIYMFSVSILSYYGVGANLEKNGMIVASIYCKGHSTPDAGNAADQGSVTIVAEIHAGDEVFVKMNERGTSYDTSLYGDHYTSFMGILLVSL